MEVLRERTNLLRESLEKSKVTTEKIVAALGSFDSRLTSLDTAMKPIQGKMHGFMRCHENINKSLKKTESIVNQFDRIREIEVVIFKGPGEDLNGFLEAMDQLMKIIRFFNARKNFKTSESVLSHANSLLSKAIDLAENEFQKMMSGLSKPIMPDRLFECLPKQMKTDEHETESNEEKVVYNLPKLIKPQFIPSLNGLAIRLVLVGQHMKCLQIYRDARANALNTTLKYLGTQRLEKEQVQKMQWENLEEKIPTWIDIMRISVKLLFAGERQLCNEVLQGIENSFQDQCFAEVTSESLGILLSFPEAVVKIKKSPEKLFMLIDMYEMMCEIEPEMEALCTGEPLFQMLHLISNLRKRLVETTAETFEGFAEIVEKDPSKPMPNGGVHPLSSYVMNFLKFLFDYQEVLKKLLAEYSTGKQNAEDLQFLPAILRILNSLHTNLEAKSKHCKEQGLSYIFTMNNIHYMVTSVMKTDAIKELLGDDWIQRKRRIVQQNSNLYRRACWAKVIENNLSSQGLGTSSTGTGGNSLSSNTLRKTVKERFRSFNAQLEEIIQKHGSWKIHDEDLRENVRLIVAEILLPAYRSFLQKFGPIVENSKTNCVKYTPEDIENLLEELFEGKAPA